MTVRTIAYGGAVFRVEGQGYEPIGVIQHVAGLEDVSLDPVLVPVSLCSDAVVSGGGLVGDPTEGALVTAAAKGGIDVGGTRDAYPRIGEVPFDSAYKFMATFHEWETDDGTPVVRCFVKGAPSVVMARSSEVRWGGEPIAMAEASPRVLEANDRLAGEGLRVIAVARRDIPRSEFDPGAELIDLVEDLDLLGLFGIVDPPRPEASVAIEDARGAGIRVRMITGDNAVTAAAIAGEIGIEGEAVTGVQVDHMGDEDFAARVDEIGVFGRVAPEHKVRLVTTLQGNGEVVAMTGDGVNDAPALKAADIGVAMGITGTEVSKQAARMVLTDDDFATIVKAVYLGRLIYDNLMKYVRFQMSSLVSFITTFVLATLFNIAMGAPLSPLQILWVNFVITGVLAIALGFDTPTPGLMNQPPRAPNASIMNRDRSVRVTIIGLTMGIVTLAATLLGPDEAEFGVASISGTMALTTLSLAHIVAALTNRFELQTVFRRDAWDNPTLTKAMGATAVAAVLVTEVGFLQRWFDTMSLSAGEWAICIVGALLVLAVDETRKAIGRGRSPEFARLRDERAAATAFEL
jgi:Ca2+-transporting ATPase